MKISLMNTEVTHKYLFAWDRMLGSSYGWSETMQIKAREDNAPLDAVYRDTEGKWHRVVDCCEDTQKRVERLVERIFGGE